MVKSEAYVATTLSWLGDPAAIPQARQVLARLEHGGDGLQRPRRAASARLDLALALSASDQLDEAAATTLDAVTSGLLVPSNYWRESRQSRPAGLLWMPPVMASLGAAGRVQLGLLGADVSEAKPVNCRDLASPESANLQRTSS